MLLDSVDNHDDDEENRVTPIASGSSAFSAPHHHHHRAAVGSNASSAASSSLGLSTTSSTTSTSLLYQQPFLYPPKQQQQQQSSLSNENDDDDDNPEQQQQQQQGVLDIRALERELRPVSAVTPSNIQRPVPVTPVTVYTTSACDSSLDHATDDEENNDDDDDDDDGDGDGAALKERQRCWSAAERKQQQQKTEEEDAAAAKRMQQRRRQRWKEQLAQTKNSNTTTNNNTSNRRRRRDQRRRSQRKQRRNNNNNNVLFDENGCVAQTFYFPASGIVSAFRNELVDVLDKLGQGCGSFGDDSEEDDLDDEEDEDSGLSDEEEEDESSTSQTRSIGQETNTRALALGPLQETMSDVTARTKYQMKDQQFLRTFISTLTQSGVIVLQHHQHQHKRSGGTRSQRPTKCLAFLQQGFQEANGQFRPPLLVWKPVEEDGEGATVDVFALLSLEKAMQSHHLQQHYPLAMPGRTVVLETASDDHPVILELRSEEDAFRFVHGIRWIVARLSFNLIIGNLAVSCEMLDVGRKELQVGDRFGQSPSSGPEEIQWMAAMNDVTRELVGRQSAATQQPPQQKQQLV